MELSTAGEYAIRGMLVLASRHGDGPVNLDEICRVRGLSKSREYMTKIFGVLAKADLVTAVRGRGGGYRLARPPKDISLLDVIEAVEGPLALNLCQHDPPQCREPGCPVRPVWDDLQAKVRAALAGKNFAQLARRLP